MIAITDKDVIICFLRGLSKDFLGRTYQDILEHSDYEMEKCHSSIQQIFPLHEFSKHAHTCPIISPEIVEEAKKYPEIEDNLLRGIDRLERFLGIGNYDDVDKQRKWCRNHNHNLLRVTRAIRCLRLFGMNEIAKEFYETVRPVCEHFGISEFTLNKWHQAFTNDVWDTLQD